MILNTDQIRNEAPKNATGYRVEAVLRGKHVVIAYHKICDGVLCIWVFGNWMRCNESVTHEDVTWFE